MGLGAYLRDRLAPLAVCALALVFVALAMRAYGVRMTVIAFMCGVLVLAGLDYTV